MRTRWRLERVSVGLLCALILGVAGAAAAGDGRIEINAASAAAGGVSAGDLPGYPVTISLPGSYVLTESLVVAESDRSAVIILADDVTLDLNGFRVVGPASCQGSGAEVVCENGGAARGIDAGSRRANVRRGTVTGFGSTGVFLGRKSRIEDVTSIANGGNGIQLLGDGLVTGCIVMRNAFAGIVGQGSSIIRYNVVAGNKLTQISGSDGAAVVGNSVARGGASGIVLTDSVGNDGGSILDNSSYGNGQSGIVADEGSLVRGNSSRSNGSFGIFTPSLGYLQNNMRSNGTNLSASTGAMDANLCDGSLTCL